MSLSSAGLMALCAVLPQNTHALAANNDSQLRQIHTGAGFCLGHDYIANEVIRADPKSKLRVNLQTSQFSLKFPGSCARLLPFLEKAIKTNPALARDIADIKATFKREINSKNKANIERYIELLASHARGEIEEPILRILLSASSPNIADPSWEMSQGWRQSFDSTGHPKAKGMKLQLQAPRSWEAREGKRPNIVHSWYSQDGKGLDSIMLLIRSAAGAGREFKSSVSSHRTAVEICEEFGVTQVEAASSSLVTIEGRQGVRCLGVQSIQRMDITLNTAVGMLFFAVDDTIVSLQALSLVEDPRDTRNSLRKTKVLIDAVGMSVVLPDRYR